MKEKTLSLRTIAYYSSPLQLGDINMANAIDKGEWGYGIYFTDNKAYAKSKHKQGYLYRCELFLDNPYICYTAEDKEIVLKLINKDEPSTFGYDGIVSLGDNFGEFKVNNYILLKNITIKIIDVEKYETM